MSLGEPREERLLGSVTVDLADRELVGRARAEDAEIFGQHDELRARRRRLVDQRLDRLREVRRDVAAGNGLHRSDAHTRKGGAAHRAEPCGPRLRRRRRRARLAVAVAPRVTTGSDQLPVTVYS